jgi:hypothetical protein
VPAVWAGAGVGWEEGGDSAAVAPVPMMSQEPTIRVAKTKFMKVLRRAIIVAKKRTGNSYRVYGL